jgi:hypothetical protein
LGGPERPSGVGSGYLDADDVGGASSGFLKSEYCFVVAEVKTVAAAVGEEVDGGGGLAAVGFEVERKLAVV